ncbi:MAG: MFS transporter [Firmicutes bacterium]|uniref:MFS transporter, CP family, cyanate transporter n=1 Tax=Melghirimyces thermohalophilus TaxID=1236220 RepID=A0A1G6K4X5_9BACL|nr:MFS transporter [Melghirimyces thermohalophilus]MDA8354645.1 MFS transporter [Bacillota bacterium]SDC26050.1 MFS transporter, CP family, cyanate transporter [Melghirimyces thermohalophilus]
MVHRGDTDARARRILLTLGVVFVAFNLRPALTSVGPLTSSIRGDLGLSNVAIGLLTTLPLLVFGLLALLAPKMGYRYGNERVIFAGLLVLLLGILIRSVSLISALFFGTLLVGVGIALGNVLLPGVIKERYPEKVGWMTSVYSTAMTAFAAVGSGFSIPLAVNLNLGWQGALAFWWVLAGIAAILWLPQCRFSGRQPSLSQKQVSSGSSLWRSPLAWQVTGYMGLQSFGFYTTVAWFPTMLHDRGLHVADAGWLLSLALIIGIPATFIAPVLADRLKDQRVLAAGIGGIYGAGYLVLLLGDRYSLSLVSAVLVGLGQGASVSLSFAFFGLRAATARQAAELSGMAQSAGYLLAAIGPFLIGWLFDRTQSWTLPLIVLTGACLLLMLSGWGAGRDRQVSPVTEG